jgi:hypothetical protein
MTERRRRFFRSDWRLDMPICLWIPAIISIACVSESATGIIGFAQLVIATAIISERLLYYVECSCFVIG